jgi:hypothetical protein
VSGAELDLPLFPLSNVVLFPRIQCPLHVFEPRYRQLAEHALARDRRIGMVAVRSEHVHAMAGDPPIFPVGCAGVITEEQRLPDGRYNIVLLGTFRFRILHEPERPAEQLYRVARVERLEDAFPPQDTSRVDELRARVIALAGDVARRIAPQQSASISAERFAGIDAAALVNALANAFPFSAPEKQGLLEADSIPERYERLESVLRFQLAEANTPAAPGPSRLH